MSRRRGNNYNSVQYQKLEQCDQNHSDTEIQQPISVRIPWKAISLAFVLCVGGLFMLILGSLIVTGHLDSKVTNLLIIIHNNNQIESFNC